MPLGRIGRPVESAAQQNKPDLLTQHLHVTSAIRGMKEMVRYKFPIDKDYLATLLKEKATLEGILRKTGIVKN